MESEDKEIFRAGVIEEEKTKTNYGLAGVVFGGLVAALGIVCWQLADPLREILATLLVIAIIVYAFLVPRIMGQMPASEQYKVRMAELGYFEVDGKLIPTEKLHLTSAQNPPQLSPAQSKAKEDGEQE